jgi:hypothetical protein
MFPTAVVLAVNAVREEVNSVRLDAPIVDDRPRRRHRVQQLRSATARALRRTADRVEPRSCIVDYG